MLQKIFLRHVLHQAKKLMFHNYKVSYQIKLRVSLRVFLGESLL
jgi:hypothetical protein